MCVKCFASQEDGRVVLAVMAMNGYHSTASYQWLHNKTLLKHNKTPLLYTSRTDTITSSLNRRTAKTAKLAESGFACMNPYSAIKTFVLILGGTQGAPFKQIPVSQALRLDMLCQISWN